MNWSPPKPLVSPSHIDGRYLVCFPNFFIFSNKLTTRSYKDKEKVGDNEKRVNEMIKNEPLHIHLLITKSKTTLNNNWILRYTVKRPNCVHGI